jgi:hypothetical protein
VERLEYGPVLGRIYGATLGVDDRRFASGPAAA